MFKHAVTGAVLALMAATAGASAQFSTGYYGGGDYRLFYSYYPDRPVQWPGGPRYGYAPPVRETIVYYPAAQPTAQEPARVIIDVKVPAQAELWIEGKKMSQTGELRRFVSPPLEPGQRYSYDFRIRWKEGSREATRVRNIDVQPGESYTIDLVNPPRTRQRIEEFPAPKKAKAEQ